MDTQASPADQLIRCAHALAASVVTKDDEIRNLLLEIERGNGKIQVLEERLAMTEGRLESSDRDHLEMTIRIDTGVFK